MIDSLSTKNPVENVSFLLPLPQKKIRKCNRLLAQCRLCPNCAPTKSHLHFADSLATAAGATDINVLRGDGDNCANCDTKFRRSSNRSRCFHSTAYFVTRHLLPKVFEEG